ncbi:MAG: patatin-like phospholipase family protein [Candidatus Promineifilaceae bacterium]|jgi:NTE family protein
MHDAVNRKSVGLALGGGVARGLAHIGVLAALEESDIPVDYVSGTSMGALVGAAYCAGIEIPELLEIASTAGWRHISSLSWPHQGLLSFQKMEEWIINRVGDIDVRDLETPFAAMATDIETGERLMLSEGPVAKVVRISCSVPGVVAPVQYHGRLLCDGGISDNLPDDAARELGADYVIGVDVFAPVYRSFLGPLGVAMAAVETLVQNAGGGMQSADCVIIPDLVGKSYLRLSKYEELIEAGRKATEETIPTIKDDLAEPSITTL